MSGKLPHRIIWAFGLGYFCLYTPYCASIKLFVRSEDLASVFLGTIVTMPLIITALGWWKYAFRAPLSTSLIASGLATAAIIAMTSMLYTLDGVTIVLALLFMRGGVLVISPFVDLACGRHVRWFSWAALAISIAALTLTMSTSHALPTATALALLVYLGGYVVRLSCMTSCAKVDDVAITRAYLVQEAVVALAILGAATLFMSRGSALSIPAAGAGVLYSGLYVFGTLIYLDRRENTFCIPLNRSVSLLAGVMASMALALPLSAAHVVSTALLSLALLLLSPAHHWVERRAAVTRPLSIANGVIAADSHAGSTAATAPLSTPTYRSP